MHPASGDVARSNEGVEKLSRDIAPVLRMLQDRGIEIFRSEWCDGPFQTNRYRSEVASR
jgi:hypothetical protein